MMNFVLFFVSFFLVLSSSYFIISVVKADKQENSLIYLCLILISQVIITFETLSIFRLIYIVPVLCLNAVFFLVAFIIWKYKNCPHIDITYFKIIKDKIYFALRKDKLLLVLSALFIYSILISLFLAVTVPTNSGDSMSYHLARIGFWLQNHTLNHYGSTSVSQIVFPINSEILILWSMVFLKRDYLDIIPEFLAFLGCLYVLFAFLSYLKISVRRILWAVLIIASLPAVIIESTSAQTNLIVAFFLFCSLYLFLYGVKENSNKSLIFSAIAGGIALGVKSTALLFMPVLGIVYLLIAIKIMKRKFYKPLAVFLSVLIPAFLLLASYNYLLNYLDFGNPFGPAAFIHRHSADFSIKFLLASIMRYFLLFIDFSGIKAAGILSSFMIKFKDFLLHLLGVNSSYGCTYADLSHINTFIHENYSLFGILGFLLILPMIFWGLGKINFSKNRAFYIGLTSLLAIGFIVIISRLMGFSYWYNRFLITAIILSSPVLIYSYKRSPNHLKIVIFLIASLNFLLIPVFNQSKPLVNILTLLSKNDFNTFRNDVRLRNELDINYKTQFYFLLNYLKPIAPDHSKIGLVFSLADWHYPFFEENQTWKIYPLRYDILCRKKNYDDYDFIIFSGEKQTLELTDDISITANKADKLESSYTDYFGKPSSLSKAFFVTYNIDFSKIPDNFKLDGILEIKNITNFYVFKKVRDTDN